MTTELGLDELHRRLESWLFTHGISTEQGPSSAKDQYGTYYTSLANGIEKKEGEAYECYYSRVTEALWRQFINELEWWLIGRRHIVWRVYPEITYDNSPDSLPRYAIYCRLSAYQDKPKPVEQKGPEGVDMDLATQEAKLPPDVQVAISTLMRSFSKPVALAVGRGELYVLHSTIRQAMIILAEEIMRRPL